MHGKKGLQRHPVPASIVIAVVPWLCASCGGAPQYDDTANMQLTNQGGSRMAEDWNAGCPRGYRRSRGVAWRDLEHGRDYRLAFGPGID
jgi:hypothetical protein